MDKHKFLYLLTAVTLILFASCKKDSKNQTPNVSLKDTAQTVNENIGTVSLTINLSKAASQNIKLTYDLSGTAILNGDYEVDSASQITIPAGQTSATLKFTIYDDAVVEGDKTIKVKISTASNANLSNATATITIKDNDVSKASNGLQTDLYWDAGSLVDLDLYIANNVVITNNTVTSLNLVDSSEHDKGFETAMINNSNPDGDYYIAVSYSSGTRNVNYTLRFNGPGGISDTTSDVFSVSDIGYAYFLGPIHKSGSTYSRLSGSIYNLEGLKRYHYYGKL